MNHHHLLPYAFKSPLPGSGAPPELVDLVDFKWLMAGEGHRIDLDRLRDDGPYIRGCLALAAGSRSSTLRQAAHRLSGVLLRAGQRN